MVVIAVFVVPLAGVFGIVGWIMRKLRRGDRLKIKSGPVALEYCEKKGMSISDFHRKFDKDLNTLMDAINKHGSFVFWICPNGCHGFVDWNTDRTEAICRSCGAKSTDNTMKGGETL